ncbi:MAG: hypothetical protein V3V14_11450 [Saprospiraceae bacterium]
MKNLLLFAFFLLSNNIYSSTYTVGTGHTYLTPKSLFNANVVQDGDTILIEAETYVGQDALELKC